MFCNIHTGTLQHWPSHENKGRPTNWHRSVQAAVMWWGNAMCSPEFGSWNRGDMSAKPDEILMTPAVYWIEKYWSRCLRFGRKSAWDHSVLSLRHFYQSRVVPKSKGIRKMGGEEQIVLACLLTWYPVKNTVSRMQHFNWECTAWTWPWRSIGQIENAEHCITRKNTELFRGVWQIWYCQS